MALGLSLWILNRFGLLGENSKEPTREIEQEMTVSEFDALIEERELAAKAPLEDKIAELESRLSEQDHDDQGSKDSRSSTR